MADDNPFAAGTATVQDILELADVVPEEGWWKSSTGEALETAVTRLLGVGVDPTVIAVTVEQIVGAVRAEYGE